MHDLYVKNHIELKIHRIILHPIFKGIPMILNCGPLPQLWPLRHGFLESLKLHCDHNCAAFVRNFLQY